MAILYERDDGLLFRRIMRNTAMGRNHDLEALFEQACCMYFFILLLFSLFFFFVFVLMVLPYPIFAPTLPFLLVCLTL
jgi:hypothetical protein